MPSRATRHGVVAGAVVAAAVAAVDVIRRQPKLGLTKQLLMRHGLTPGATTDKRSTLQKRQWHKRHK